MRDFDEILVDLNTATAREDKEGMKRFAEEMSALGTNDAMVRASNTLGTLNLRSGKYAAALEHYQHAYALLQEDGDVALIADVMRSIGDAYNQTGDYDAALDHYNRSLEAYERIGDPSGIAMALSFIASVHNSRGSFSIAVEHHQRSLDLFTQVGDRLGIAQAMGNMGNVLRNTGEYASALEHFHRALEIFDDLDNNRASALFISNIGNVYVSTGDYVTALKHYRRALDMQAELGDRTGIARTTANIGIVYGYTADYPTALEHFHRARELYEEIGYRSGLANLHGNLGNAYFLMEDFNAALAHFRTALDLNTEIGDQAAITHLLGSIASVYLRLDRTEEASQILDQQASMPMDMPSTRAVHHKNLSVLAARSGDLQSADDHLRRALSIMTEKGARSEAADYHQLLRDLAQKRNDFAGYIEHNNEYHRITEEIRGKEATQRLTMIDAERRMEAERREREKERAVLYSTLPKHVADRVIRGEDVSGDHFDNAVVMFLDIVGFTSHTSHLPPTDVVKMLEHIFSTIDSICDQHDVIKIKTIGDSYMCFAHEENPEQRVAAVALAIQQSEFYWPRKDSHEDLLERLRFRIGIHRGPVTAGVIGTQRLQYDVWGDTVNVASRMESTGEPGRIHVSEAFANALNTSPPSPLSSLRGGTNIVGDNGSAVIPNEVRNEEHVTWHLALRGETELKGKGRMTTYWLEDTWNN